MIPDPVPPAAPDRAAAAIAEADAAERIVYAGLQRPGAADATAGDGLRDAIAGEVARLLYRYSGINEDQLIVIGKEFAAESPALRDVLAAAEGDREKLERVRALHVVDRWGDECAGCRQNCLYCEGEHPWPCPTRLAIDPELAP